MLAAVHMRIMQKTWQVTTAGKSHVYARMGKGVNFTSSRLHVKEFSTYVPAPLSY
jgi:hypothetical protein